MWTDENQWMRCGFGNAIDPTIDPLEVIECRGAILAPDGSEPDWPRVDAVVGNPPFPGGKLLIDGLGESDVPRMYAALSTTGARGPDQEGTSFMRMRDFTTVAAALSLLFLAACAGGGALNGGEAFRGEGLLRANLGGQMSGKVLIYDLVDDDSPPHHALVKSAMTGAGVPPQNIAVKLADYAWFPGAGGAYWHYRIFNHPSFMVKNLKVVNLSFTQTFVTPETARTVEDNNVVFVASAGNTDKNPLDLYTRSSPQWGDMDRAPWGGTYSYGHSTYREVMQTAATGKVLFAVWGKRNSNGISPDPGSVRCGDIKHACITVILHSRFRHGGPGTSLAAPVVAAAFFLSQFFDKAEDVVGVLKECAIDIGEPGVDEEFGVGALNLDCPAVRNKLAQFDSASIRQEEDSVASN